MKYDGWTCSIKVDEKFLIQEWEDFTLKFKAAIKERERERERESHYMMSCLLLQKLYSFGGSLVTK